jgi:hypothetical protein
MADNPFDFTGRTALVTGSGSDKGIGFRLHGLPSTRVVSDMRFDPAQTATSSSVKDRC